MTEKGKQPQNVAATATGALAIVAIWFWNQAQLVEVCGQEGDPPLMECVLEPGRLFLANEVYASVVLLITALTGPLVRKYLSWANKGGGADPDLIAQAAEAGAQAAIDKLRAEGK